MLVSGFKVSAAGAADAGRKLPFLSGGDVTAVLRRPLTLLVGENGCGKTSLMEAIAGRLRMRRTGGGSLLQTDEDPEAAVLCAAVSVDHVCPCPAGWFMRADSLAGLAASAGRIQAMDGGWKAAAEMSRGEGMLSLLAAKVDASEGCFYLLDEPETGLSPERQLGLLVLLDEIARDGRSQALVATHSPILMGHPEASILWMDEDGILPRDLEDVPHWSVMRRFMRDPAYQLRHLFPERENGAPK